MGSHVIRRAGFISASPERVMALLREAPRWPDWQPEILDAQGPAEVEPGDSVDGSASMLGFRVAGHARVSVLTGRTLDHEVIVGVRMRVRYELREAHGGTVLVHVLQTDLPRGPAGRFLSLFLRPRLRRMQARLLSNLAEIAAADAARPPSDQLAQAARAIRHPTAP